VVALCWVGAMAEVVAVARVRAVARARVVAREVARVVASVERRGRWRGLLRWRW
jgi:hypothetical protein